MKLYSTLNSGSFLESLRRSGWVERHWAWHLLRWWTGKRGWQFLGRCWYETMRTWANHIAVHSCTPDRCMRFYAAKEFRDLSDWALSQCHTDPSDRPVSMVWLQGQTGNHQWSGQKWPLRKSAHPSCFPSLDQAGPGGAWPHEAGWCPRPPEELRESAGSQTWPLGEGCPWCPRCPVGWTSSALLSIACPQSRPAGGWCRHPSSAAMRPCSPCHLGWPRGAPEGSETSCSQSRAIVLAIHRGDKNHFNTQQHQNICNTGIQHWGLGICWNKLLCIISQIVSCTISVFKHCLFDFPKTKALLCNATHYTYINQKKRNKKCGPNVEESILKIWDSTSSRELEGLNTPPRGPQDELKSF